MARITPTRGTAAVVHSAKRQDLTVTKNAGVSKDQILGALPALNASDLTMVQAAVNQLLGAATGATEPGAGPLGETVFSALGAALGLSVPFAALPSDIARRFKNSLPPLVTFLDTNFDGWQANKITQLAFLRMLFGLLVDDLKRRGVNPMIGIIIVNMVRLPEVFNAAFPGYLEAGLGGVILKQCVKGNGK
jgi:hypothetical protein